MLRSLRALSLLALGSASCLLLPVRPAAGGDVEPSLQNTPPVVVETVPAAGSENVGPQTEAIRVTFSKQMMDGSWSWVQLSQSSFPKTTGAPRYLEDGKTCVLPVKLEPGKTYAIWVNSSRFTNFKDADGRSAVPYLLVFSTSK